MSEPRDAGHMLEAAEQAAIAGDLESADALLRGALRVQEATLGPLHPQLANTLNNLAIVAEKTGRLDEAETFYRRAVAIAADSLPAGDPMIAASRENLEAFCRARGLPIDLPAIALPPVPGTAPVPNQPASGKVPTADPGRSTTALPSALQPPAPAPPAPAIAEPLPPGSSSSTPSLVWAIGAAAVLFVALLVWRPWSSERSGPASPAPAPPPAAERAQPPATEPSPARPVPTEPSRPAAAAPKSADRGARSSRRPNRPTSSATVTLTAAQLCQSFATSGASWHCVPAGEQAAPGRLVLYTRVKSAADGSVVHRWYRGTALRQSVTLKTLANATQGYRTFSQQTVDGAQDWRVEVRSANGDLLYEQRFAVR